MPYYIYHHHIRADVGNNVLHFRFIYTILYDLSWTCMCIWAEAASGGHGQLSIAYPHSANENLIVLMGIFECTVSI